MSPFPLNAQEENDFWEVIQRGKDHGFAGGKHLYYICI